MNGYLAPVSPDAATRLAYRSAQCALCHHLGAEYGPVYRLLAGPDMVFLALLREVGSGEVAKIGHRACVIAPLVTRLPVRELNEGIRYAAAIGVYMAVEKLRDNWQDEGGWWRWLAWRSLRSGQERARAALVALGVNLGEIEAWLEAQSAIERGNERDLEVAAAPTRSIAAACFGGGNSTNAAALARIGHHVGGFLFWMDGLLDLPRDLESGSYNPLARSFGIERSSPGAHEAARALALARASEEVDALAVAVAALPETGVRGTLHRSVVLGFRDKLRRYRALPPAALARADLGDLLPPRTPVTHALAMNLERARARMPVRLRVAVAFLAAWLFPRAAWAADWWPEGADPGLDGAGDTGALAATADTGGIAVGNDCGNLCDPCASNFGWWSCNLNCDDACGNVCGSACDGAC
ncbi:hypothetical protein LBMAG42_25870 [Deltaproteobacteria bacterium]|nr:hypothetical protein LBMAG42_25870 [Deltaproteobacteria bacterium]